MCGAANFMAEGDFKMRSLALIVVGALVPGAAANAAPLSGAGMKSGSDVVLVQDRKDKKESIATKMTNKVKRAWKRVAGYKFTVNCPAFPPITTRSCNETGRDRDAARGKCIAQNPTCWVADAK